MKKALRNALLLGIYVVVVCAYHNAAVRPVSVPPLIPFHPLHSTADLDTLINEIGNRKIILLGEASHGTGDYYEWRTAISKRLIQEKGFRVIAVEGEWADSYRVNQFVKGPLADSIQTVALLRQYDRWPTWMWGNYQVASLITWLNRYNHKQPAEKKAGFYGLDLFCLWESMQELRPYLQDHDSLVQIANKVEQCFKPFSAEPMRYASAVANSGNICRSQTQQLWLSVFDLTGRKTAATENEFVLQQNALVALNGENYYRTSASNYPESWNIRDRHMTQTAGRLLSLYGANAKIIVWAHNTHVGDARFTNMTARGQVNVGQLLRERFGANEVYAVGFGSYSGQVIASDRWNGAVQTMLVPPAKPGSWEELLHKQNPSDMLLLSKELQQLPLLRGSIGHRAIGVKYNPGQESGNYVPSIIPKRYDAFIYIDRTRALSPLGTPALKEPPDTYPSGF